MVFPQGSLGTVPPPCKTIDTVQMSRRCALKQPGGEISKHLASVEHATTSTELIASIPRAEHVVHPGKEASLTLMLGLAS